jgi:hypothetical protein
MKNAIKFAGFIAIAAIIGFTFAALSLTGCNSGGGESPSIYANENNWLAIPDNLEHEADLLFFYPTTYSPNLDTNPDAPVISPLDDTVMRQYARLAFGVRATAFETVADIYAPFYQQVDIRRVEASELTAIERDTAHQSLFLALDYYFENFNNGRPYFLAGHSQGASMITYILDEYLKKRPQRYAKMIAAYMIGYAPTQTWLDENEHIKFAEGADDTGVLISWNAEGPGNIGEYNLVVPDGAVAINPLNWRRDNIPATTAENLGSFLPDTNGVFRVVEPGIANAQLNIERGSVIVTDIPADYTVQDMTAAYAHENKTTFGPQSYHSWDYEFFYMNIRANAANRLQRYLE